MTHQTYVLGIDISTTGAKALLINEHGEVVHSESTPLSLSTPFPLWSEQDPHSWWSGIVQSIRKALAHSNIKGNQIAAIGLTGQMHGLVLVDSAGQVLRPAILWNDQRTGTQCQEIRDRIGKKRLIHITGNDALTGFTAPKILWVQENEPDIFAKSSKVLLPKDYVRYRLTGQYAMDKADGSGTILFDLAKRDWSEEILESLGIPRQWMPQTFEGPVITGNVSKDAAAETGLVPGIPVVAGGGDQAAQAVGVGVVEPGIIALTLGTSGVVFASTPEPFIESEGRLHAFCHALPDHWHLMGVMLSAAGSLTWHRETVASGMSFDELVHEADEIRAGSDGLFFLPYLTGERTPYPDPYARAGWIGLTLRHSRAHMTRAVLEGVAYGLKDSFELMRAAGLGGIHQVRISGGGAKSNLWRQILASVLGVELVTINTTEGAAYGAALLAGVGAGIWPDVLKACQETVVITGRDTPDSGQVEVYAKGYHIYRSLYPTLKPVFDQVTSL
jgi:xylulokinase